MATGKKEKKKETGELSPMLVGHALKA